MKTLEHHNDHEGTCFERIVGLVANRSQFQALSEAFDRLGVHQVDVSMSDPGINYLESEHDTMAKCLLGEMEGPSLAHYVAAANTGSIVFAAWLDSDIGDLIAAVAGACGATDIVHMRPDSTTSF